MIINLKQLNTHEVEGTVTPKKMRLSTHASSMVFQMFTKNVYGNAIGTVVREITSNCFDSHVEANVNTPVIIKKSIDDDNNIYISFIDFGVGMSPERIYDIYGVYFETTKRATNEQIGGFGIGGKTPFAYKRGSETEYDNSFYVITNYNQTKYVYLMLEGIETPEIALLHSEPTTERNGTEVRIPILPNDLLKFKKEIIQQLYYFENIIFEGFEVGDDLIPHEYDNIINNDYQIVRGNSFLFRGPECDGNIHVCLGRVAYPLDYKTLGLSSTENNIPIALRFEVGELNVTLSRESLDYSTESAVKLIKARLAEAILEIKELLVKQYSSISNLEDYFKVKNNFGMLLMPNDQTVYVGNVIKQKDVGFKKFRYSTLSLPNDRELFKLFFNAKLYGKKPVKSRRYFDNDKLTLFENSYKHLVEKDNLYFVDGPVVRKNIKLSYLKNLHPVRYYVITKKDLLKDHYDTMSNISAIFNIYDEITDVEGNPTEYLKTLIELQNEYYEIVKKYNNDYNNIIIPDSFKNVRRYGSGITDEIKNTTIPVKFVNLSQYRVKLDSLFNTECQIFYGTREKENELEKACSIYKLLYNEENIVTGYNDVYDSFSSPSSAKIMFILLAKANVKYMKYCENAFPISKFKENILMDKEGEIKKYFQMKNLIKPYNDLNRIYKSPEFNRLSPDWTAKLKDVCNYVDYYLGTSINFEFYEHMIRHYFTITDIKLTSKQEKYLEIINQGIEMQEINTETLKYIDIPYNLNDEAFWNIMKKILIY